VPIAVLCSSLGAQADTDSQAFIKKAIEGNLAEIAVGTLAQQKSSSDGIKQFGQQLQADHTAANDKAMQAAKAVFVDPPKEPSSEQKSAYDKLTHEQGGAFDRDFLAMMVDDHNKAIADYQRESSANDAAGQYAKASLPTLQKHLATAQSLTKSVPDTTASVQTPVNPPGAPFSGANSFTEGQARSRIESAGFGSVTGLKMDSQGVWRGTASKNGKTVSVALDFKGNVVSQ
jgi:putative membrane protein